MSNNIRIALVEDVEEMLNSHEDITASEEVLEDLGNLYYDDLVVVSMNLEEDLVEAVKLVEEEHVKSKFD